MSAFNKRFSKEDRRSRLMCEIKSTGLRIGAIAILTFLTWYSHEPAKVAAGGTSCSQQNDKRAGQTSTANPANSWKTLVPLRSTRADVERMFGKAEIPNGGYHLYKFEKEKVFFTSLTVIALLTTEVGMLPPVTSWKLRSFRKHRCC